MGNYKAKTYITAALIIVLVFAISFLFTVLYSQLLVDDYRNMYDISAENVNGELNAHTETLKSKAAQVDADAPVVPVGVLYAGSYVVAEGSALGSATYVDAEGNIITGNFSAVGSVSSDGGVAILPLNEILSGTDVTDNCFVAISQNEDGIRQNFVISDVTLFNTKVENYAFKDVIVLSADGALLFSLSGADRAAFIKNFTQNNNNEEMFLNGGAFNFSASYQGDDTVFFIAEKGGNTGFRICGSVLSEDFNAHTMSIILLIILEILIIIIFALAGMFIMNIFYRRNMDAYINTRVPMNYYDIKVSRSGEIVSANKRFTENFDVKDITEFLLSESMRLDKKISESQPIFVKLDGKDGREYFIDFVPFKTVFGYRLVGGDSSPFLQDYHEFKQKKLVDPYTSLPVRGELEKEIENVLLEGRGISCLIGKIAPANTEKIMLMLGENLSQQLISLYAKHLDNVLRKYGKIYSVGSQAFMFYTDNMEKANELIADIQEIMKQLSEVFKINDNIIKIDSCCGFVVVDSKNKEISMDNIQYNCEIAFKYANDNQKMRYYILRNFKFDAQNTDFTEKGLVLKMIENGEFEIYYQPQYEINTMKLSGFEALLRIVSERKKEIRVDKLISIAEQYGGMVELGRFVYENAMDFAKEIQGSDVEIAINVSAIQLMQIGFTEYFLEAYRERNLERGALNIEITEGTMIHSFDEVAAKLNILKENGIGTHIDDFGVAYSSMLYLQRLPVSVVKIDKSLIDEIVINEGNMVITKGIIQIAKDLKMKCIAEGVESTEQRDVLKTINCDYMQGFLMSKALTHEDALKLVKEK